jgi:hypothetical protein
MARKLLQLARNIDIYGTIAFATADVAPKLAHSWGTAKQVFTIAHALTGSTVSMKMISLPLSLSPTLSHFLAWFLFLFICLILTPLFTTSFRTETANLSCFRQSSTVAENFFPGGHSGKNWKVTNQIDCNSRKTCLCREKHTQNEILSHEIVCPRLYFS